MKKNSIFFTAGIADDLVKKSIKEEKKVRSTCAISSCTETYTSNSLVNSLIEQ